MDVYFIVSAFSLKGNWKMLQRYYVPSGCIVNSCWNVTVQRMHRSKRKREHISLVIELFLRSFMGIKKGNKRNTKTNMLSIKVLCVKYLRVMMMNCFCCYGWPTKGVLALFPAGTIVRDPHHHESLTYFKQDLTLCRTWVQVLLNEVVQ